MTKSIMDGRDIQTLLDLWGGWAASDNSGLDFSHIAAGFKGLLPSTSKSRLQCNDDEGLVIDSCVAKLKQHRPKEYELVVLHYVYGVSLRAIAKRRKCSDGLVRKELERAVGFMEGTSLKF
ncbi:antiterminator Q family protein [Rouxiella sp. T17]|uniref:antiterminator Q family protein n=1 Tax=Rouxiella sp. T17 TaxID=3085684 RepID=UPI002FC5BFE7